MQKCGEKGDILAKLCFTGKSSCNPKVESTHQDVHLIHVDIGIYSGAQGVEGEEISMSLVCQLSLSSPSWSCWLIISLPCG